MQHHMPQSSTCLPTFTEAEEALKEDSMSARSYLQRKLSRSWKHCVAKLSINVQLCVLHCTTKHARRVSVTNIRLSEA